MHDICQENITRNYYLTSVVKFVKSVISLSHAMKMKSRIFMFVIEGLENYFRIAGCMFLQIRNRTLDQTFFNRLLSLASAVKITSFCFSIQCHLDTGRELVSEN